MSAFLEHFLPLVALGLIIGGAGLVYFGLVNMLLLGLTRLLRWRWDRSSTRSFRRGFIAGLLVVAIGIPMFLGIAGMFRHTPVGPPIGANVRLERQGIARDRYVFWTRLAFFTLYGVALLASSVAGYIPGGQAADRSGAIGFAATAALSPFLLLTLPYVDFLNACTVGEPFISKARC